MVNVPAAVGVGAVYTALDIGAAVYQIYVSACRNTIIYYYSAHTSLFLRLRGWGCNNEVIISGLIVLLYTAGHSAPNKISYVRFHNCKLSSRNSAGGGGVVGPGGEGEAAADFIPTQYVATIPLMTLK